MAIVRRVARPSSTTIGRLIIRAFYRGTHEKALPKWRAIVLRPDYRPEASLLAGE
jgi:hypothetical protein